MDDAIDSDGMHVSPKMVKAIENYMVKLLDALDLGHWRVYVAKDMPPEGTRMAIEATDGRRIAMLFVSDTWEGSSEDEKQVDLTHEALHLTHHDQDEHVRRFIESSSDLSTNMKHQFMSQFFVNTERMVDSLSYVIAPNMPKWRDPK